MARPHYFIGLDVGSASVRFVALGRNESGVLSVAGVSEQAIDGMRKGAVASPDLVARGITKAALELKKQYGIEANHAVVSLGEPRIVGVASKGAVSISRADGEVTREDVARVLENAEGALPRLGNREILHQFPLFYNVDHDTRLREAIGLVGAKLEVEALFVAAFSAHMRNLYRALELAGIVVDDMLAAPYAASFHALSRKQKEVGCVLINIGAQTSGVAVFEEGMLVSLEMIPVGSGHITYDIGLGFQIDTASAERVKRNLASFLEQGKKEIRLSDFPKNFEDSFSQRKLKEIVSARLGDIFELVAKHLKRIDRAELLPGGVILAGGGSKLYDIGQIARDELRLPIEMAQGAPGLGERKELVSGPEWVTAAGLARFAADQHSPAGRMSELFSSSFSQRVKKILRSLIP
ncbi:MAG: cell division protein FtsA [Patescibacteria group bacterium]